MAAIGDSSPYYTDAEGEELEAQIERLRSEVEQLHAAGNLSMARIEQLQVDVYTLEGENDRLHAERDDWKETANTGKAFCDAKLAEAALFLDALAEGLAHPGCHPSCEACRKRAAECHTMAEKLRGVP